MSPSTSCPACGAPIDYRGGHDEIRCGFCGTYISVDEDENGQTRFEVLAQPRPQTDVLTERAEEVSEEVMDEAADAAGSAWGFEELASEPPEPAAPAWSAPEPTRSVAEEEPFRLEIPPAPATTPIPETPVYQLTGPSPVNTTSNRRWIWIIVAVLGVLLLGCVCLGVILVNLFQSGAIIF